MRVLIYVNSAFGVGHYRRVSHIYAALCRRAPECQVTTLIGGVPLPGLYSVGDRVVRLPELNYWKEWGELNGTGGLSLDETLRIRRSIIKSVVDYNRYDILLLEHVPFGKVQLLPEVEFLLREYCRRAPMQGKVVCSVRDVASVRPEDDMEVLEFANAYLDLILVHADPALFPLYIALGDTSGLHVEVRYTGFIVGRCLQTRVSREGLIVAVVGGGQDGDILWSRLDWIREKLTEIYGRDLDLRLFPGFFGISPSIRGLRVETAERFEAVLAEAEIVIGLAGYNVCYESLGRGRKIILLPRDRREQRLRAERLAELGYCRLLDSGLSSELVRPGDSGERLLDITGADCTARWLYDIHTIGLEQALARNAVADQIELPQSGVIRPFSSLHESTDVPGYRQ